MTILERIEQEISRLSRSELAQFRAWYSDFDADAWDRQIEGDAHGGQLDALAELALQSHRAGKPRPL